MARAHHYFHLRSCNVVLHPLALSTTSRPETEVKFWLITLFWRSAHKSCHREHGWISRPISPAPGSSCRHAPRTLRARQKEPCQTSPLSEKCVQRKRERERHLNFQSFYGSFQTKRGCKSEEEPLRNGQNGGRGRGLDGNVSGEALTASVGERNLCERNLSDIRSQQINQEIVPTMYKVVRLVKVTFLQTSIIPLRCTSYSHFFLITVLCSLIKKNPGVGGRIKLHANCATPDAYLYLIICHRLACIYNRFAFLHISGNQILKNLLPIESRQPVALHLEGVSPWFAINWNWNSANKRVENE